MRADSAAEKTTLIGSIGKFIMGTILFCVFLAIMIWLICDAASDIRINPVDPVFRLHSATLSLPNASASEFTATWDVTVVAFNLNHKLNISFNSLQATIFYETDPRGRPTVLLAMKSVPPPSFLTTKAQTTHRFRVETVSAYVADDVAKHISEGRARGGLWFELEMLAFYRYTSYDINPRMVKACYLVEFGFSPGNWIGVLTQTGQPVDNGATITHT